MLLNLLVCVCFRACKVTWLHTMIIFSMNVLSCKFQYFPLRPCASLEKFLCVPVTDMTHHEITMGNWGKVLFILLNKHSRVGKTTKHDTLNCMARSKGCISCIYTTISGTIIQHALHRIKMHKNKTNPE